MIDSYKNATHLFCLLFSARYDCKDINKEGGKSSGVYSVRGCDNCGWTDVYCDMDTDDGGWMVCYLRNRSAPAVNC